MIVIVIKIVKQMKFVVSILIPSESVCVSILMPTCAYYLFIHLFCFNSKLSFHLNLKFYYNLFKNINIIFSLFNTDVCLFDRCGPNAECFGENHLAVCRCPAGYEGNPIDPHVGCIRKLSY